MWEYITNVRGDAQNYLFCCPSGHTPILVAWGSCSDSNIGQTETKVTSAKMCFGLFE